MKFKKGSYERTLDLAAECAILTARDQSQRGEILTDEGDLDLRCLRLQARLAASAALSLCDTWRKSDELLDGDEGDVLRLAIAESSLNLASLALVQLTCAMGPERTMVSFLRYLQDVMAGTKKRAEKPSTLEEIRKQVTLMRRLRGSKKGARKPGKPKQSE